MNNIKDPAILNAEAEIDAELRLSALREESAPQAIWSILSTIDNTYFRNLMDGTKVQFMHFTLTKIVDIPLRCLLADHGKFPAGALDFSRGLETQQLAHDWLTKCITYQGFEAIFPRWHRNKLSLKLDGNRLVPIDDEPGDPYDAYNVIVGDEGGLVEERPMGLDLNEVIPKLGKCVTKIGDTGCFRVVPSPPLVQRMSEYVPLIHPNAWSLPEEWDFGNFTLGDFKRVYLGIQALALAWIGARLWLSYKGHRSISGVCHISIDDLDRLLHEAFDLPLATVRTITEILTFGSLGIKSPDVLKQPLVVSSDGKCFITPIIWFNTNPENNLCSLLNKIELYRKIYSKLSTEKESLMFSEAQSRLKAIGFEVRTGNINTTDVDLAIIDHRGRTCLCVELKWFISPGPIGECQLRGEDLAKGIEQAKKISTAYLSKDPDLARILSLDSGKYEFLAMVSSMNWIGNEENQDPEVPILKFQHLLATIEKFGGLAETISWLRKRRYLPVKDIDFECMVEPVRCGRWESTVGAFRRIEKTG